MIKRFLITFVLIIASWQAYGQSKSFGHNLTATSHVLEKNQATVGAQVVAFGLSEELSIATSTWLLSDYDMYNLYVRYNLEKTENRSQSVQLGYFHTDPSAKIYDMSLLWLNWIHGWKIRPGYNFFLNLQGLYYFNENLPFSLRRPRIWRDPTEWVISSLHEVELSSGFYLQGEFGILGLIRKYPLIHTGVSLQWRTQDWLIQLGYSMTGNIHAFNDPGRRSDTIGRFGISNGSQNGLGDAADSMIRYDFSIHPEVTVQYFF